MKVQDHRVVYYKSLGVRHALGTSLKHLAWRRKRRLQVIEERQGIVKGSWGLRHVDAVIIALISRLAACFLLLRGGGGGGLRHDSAASLEGDDGVPLDDADQLVFDGVR